MKHQYNRIVVLMNDFETIDTLLEKAVAFSQEHEALLEILYVHEEPLFDIPDFFLSDKAIHQNQIDKEKIKDKIEEHLESYNLEKPVAILVYLDDTQHQLLNLLKEDKKALVLTPYHKDLTPELIANTPYSFWIIKNKEGKKYEKILFTTDLSEEAKAYIPIAQHIFGASHIHLFYDYQYILETLVLREDYFNITPVPIDVDMQLNEIKKAQALEQFNQLKKEFNLEGTFMEGEAFLEDDVATFIENDAFDLVIMYRKDEEFFSSPSLILSLVDSLSTDFFIF